MPVSVTILDTGYANEQTKKYAKQNFVCRCLTIETR